MPTTVEDMRIGDFTRPAAPDAPRSPTEEVLKAAENKLDSDVQKDEAVLKPMQSYEDKLKEAGVTKEEAAEIVDSVLLKGHYSKEYAITKRIKARFRTRNARDTRRAQDMLEAMRLSMASHYNEMLGRFLLAASLELFGNDKLEHPAKDAKSEDVEKSYSARLTYVENMSDPALRIAFDKLRVFDNMISVVLEEGTIENF